MEVLGTAGDRCGRNSPGALLRGRVERMHPGVPDPDLRRRHQTRCSATIIGMVALGIAPSQPLIALEDGHSWIFSTTEAAQDLGGLVDTIVDSVCHAGTAT